MRVFKADLHIHTALSPCAEKEMTPKAIVKRAMEKGLDIIAVCDHNSAGNAEAVIKAGGKELAVIPGVEFSTSEDIHIVGLFPSPAKALTAVKVFSSSLPDISENIGGTQLMFDEHDTVIGTEKKMLSASSTVNLNETISLIKRNEGIAIAAHVNRPSFSVISQLGFFPAGSDFDAIEVFKKTGESWRIWKSYGLPIFFSSDSHFLDDIGSIFTLLVLEKPTFEELLMAVTRKGGRGVLDA